MRECVHPTIPTPGVGAARRTGDRGDMATSTRSAHRPHGAHRITDGRVLHVPGARIELLTPPATADEAPCLLRGTIPPGGVVPLHRHPDPETFVGVAGRVDGLSGYPGDPVWVGLGRRRCLPRPFSCDVAAPAARTQPPDAEVIAAFLETARRYGHWNASPAENAAIGIAV